MSERKFLSLPLPQQHKKCLEALKDVLECKKEIEEYLIFLDWMGLEKPLLDKKSLYDNFHFHLQMADLSLKEHNLLPIILKGDKEFAKKLLPIDIYLDHVRSAHNVGSIVRTVEAFSLGEIHLSPKTPSLSQKKVKDAAMGASEWVTCCENASIEDLKRPIIALETVENAFSIYDYHFPPSFTLAVGNEEYGLSDALLSQADAFIYIPMHGKKNSLNVANAFAIAAAFIDKAFRP